MAFVARVFSRGSVGRVASHRRSNVYVVVPSRRRSRSPDPRCRTRKSLVSPYLLHSMGHPIHSTTSSSVGPSFVPTPLGPPDVDPEKSGVRDGAPQRRSQLFGRDVPTISVNGVGPFEEVTRRLSHFYMMRGRSPGPGGRGS